MKAEARRSRPDKATGSALALPLTYPALYDPVVFPVLLEEGLDLPERDTARGGYPHPFFSIPAFPSFCQNFGLILRRHLCKNESLVLGIRPIFHEGSPGHVCGLKSGSLLEVQTVAQDLQPRGQPILTMGGAGIP